MFLHLKGKCDVFVCCLVYFVFELSACMHVFSAFLCACYCMQEFYVCFSAAFYVFGILFKAVVMVAEACFPDSLQLLLNSI